MQHMEQIFSFFVGGELGRLLLAVLAVVLVGLIGLGIVGVPGRRSLGKDDDALAASSFSSHDSGHH